MSSLLKYNLNNVTDKLNVNDSVDYYGEEDPSGIVGGLKHKTL